MMDLYKAYLSDLQSIGTRYTAANAFYMTIVSALLGVLALGVADKPFSPLRLVIILMVSGFAIIVCWIWRKTIDFYSNLFHAKFEILQAIEAQGKFEMPLFTREKESLKQQSAGSLLRNERRVPIIMGLFFLAVVVLAWVYKQ